MLCLLSVLYSLVDMLCKCVYSQKSKKEKLYMRRVQLHKQVNHFKLMKHVLQEKHHF